MKPELLKAAENPDWMQVVYNQGPPCFHVESGRFCPAGDSLEGCPTKES